MGFSVCSLPYGPGFRFRVFVFLLEFQLFGRFFLLFWEDRYSFSNSRSEFLCFSLRSNNFFSVFSGSLILNSNQKILHCVFISTVKFFNLFFKKIFRCVLGVACIFRFSVSIGFLRLLEMSVNGFFNLLSKIC